MGSLRTRAQRRAKLASVLLACLLTSPLTNSLAGSLAGAPAARVAADFRGEKAGADARALASWVLDSGDARGQPFVVIDKRRARAYVFDGQGRLRAAAPVLLGYAQGDDSVPGIGERPIAQIRPHERTTPAGRFLAEPGVNAKGEDIVWVDYDAAISMHRVRPTNPKERRLQRLASPTPADNRISYGCINMPPAFFNTQIKPLFRNGRRRLVYVLPETRPVQALFGAPASNTSTSTSTRGVRAASAG